MSSCPLLKSVIVDERTRLLVTRASIAFHGWDEVQKARLHSTGLWEQGVSRAVLILLDL